MGGNRTFTIFLLERKEVVTSDFHKQELIRLIIHKQLTVIRYPTLKVSHFQSESFQFIEQVNYS